MRKVLYIMSEFKDQDVDWFMGAGSAEAVPAGHAIIERGRPIETLYTVLRGKFVVDFGSRQIRDLGIGEIFGELSFLDARPPLASVVAMEPAIVLALPSRRLKAKFRTDPAFAARFYRALGVLLADRLRETVGQFTYDQEQRLDEDVEARGELSPELLDNLALAAARFDRMLHRMLGDT